jgi:cytochrome c
MLLRICCLLIATLTPPIALIIWGGNRISSKVSLILWGVALYVFFEAAALIGILIHLMLVCFAVFCIMFRQKQILTTSTNYKYFYYSTVFLFFGISIFAFQSRISYESNFALNQQMSANGKLLFNQCKSCHLLSKNNFIGPSLSGIYGRRAGVFPGYDYSTSFKETDLIWTEQNLMKFLTNQEKVVPGTKMIISPLEKEDILDIIEYLKLR